MNDMWMSLSGKVGITDEPFVIVATVEGETKNYIYYFEGIT